MRGANQPAKSTMRWVCYYSEMRVGQINEHSAR
jgi:hypothetical protein